MRSERSFVDRSVKGRSALMGISLFCCYYDGVWWLKCEEG